MRENYGKERERPLLICPIICLSCGVSFWRGVAF